MRRRILVVDNDDRRIYAFEKIFEKDDVDYTDSADNAIDLYIENDYDLICLDYQLNDREHGHWDPDNTGLTVAKFLSNSKCKTPVIIHTVDHWGAQRMAAALPGASYRPGYWLDKKLDVV